MTRVNDEEISNAIDLLIYYRIVLLFYLMIIIYSGNTYNYSYSVIDDIKIQQAIPLFLLLLSFLYLFPLSL